jgi:hypothetical protein
MRINIGIVRIRTLMDDRTEARQETPQSGSHFFVIVDYYNLKVVQLVKQSSPPDTLLLLIPRNPRWL